MATKKQKREAALAKRQEFLEKERQIGLNAQDLDRLERESRAAQIKAEVEAINERHRATLRDEATRAAIRSVSKDRSSRAWEER